MTTEHFEQAWKTETTVRQIDKDGAVTSETVTVVTRREPPHDDQRTGMYL